MKFNFYNPKEASNCILRSFSKITGKNGMIIETELKDLAKQMDKNDYSDIEVFEKYLEQLGFEKYNCLNDVKIKDLNLDNLTYSIFCWDKKDYYHLVTISENILYDKKEETLELYPISIYKLRTKELDK
ncbi:MAG: hypothetical protein PUA90_03110 [bacterium]|nr:hypothetical protein [bacterium]